MEDAYGHRISYLRVSITDRCNERCRYCMPEELQEWLPRADILSYEEILRVLRVGAGLGIRKVRVTGGEPLTRRDVLTFFRELQTIEGIEDVGVSTNGTLLASCPEEDGVSMAEHLVLAGVRTANVSLDTLDAETYRQATGRDYFSKVLDGLDAARAAGFESIKLNSVLMRDSNEDQIVPIDVPTTRQRHFYSACSSRSNQRVYGTQSRSSAVFGCRETSHGQRQCR